MVTSLRSLSTSAVRRFASAASAESHGDSAGFWKKVFIFAGIPAILLGHVNAFVLPEGHGHRPEFKPYPYLRIRKKAFPWGDGNHSLFHSANNALPDGYEDDA
uniref:Cytochrome c oxidase polypeptide VIa-liver n=1 Tax=Caligus rogercresseyi TaxID=217165 RepID=C1BRD2_CALRO|nr:Cytochrome c oxidase polypeptide VIa-liver [Caligus rogercresseyi]|eukprot:TRINITY_DN2763_c0_g1_i1.p2 TRINITY_DN2763_c0_g1~~TRINITY_DN2763_c0_g1_i1.p2  ORF type:complete len:103 (-),score=25.82 TRINITY_DN2763_c0_g1_i1:184-492(-)